MGEILNRQIEHANTWTAETLAGGKEALVRTLTPAQLDAIEELLAKTRHKPPQQVTRDEWDHPVLNAYLKEMADEIAYGRGIVITRGVGRDRFSEDDYLRLYWGFGLHLGFAEVQSHNGDRLGYVEKVQDDPRKRPYRNDTELRFHTDPTETAGLMSVRQGASGGVSGLVSIGAIHNIIQKERPEMLAPLYEGYFYSMEEMKDKARPVTDEKIPVLCNVDGKVSAAFVPNHMVRAAEKLGNELSPTLKEAIAYFVEVANRPGVALHFMLEPGEIMIWDNYVYMHARTSFTDAPPEKKRLLLRLWVTPDRQRDVTPQMFNRAETYRQLHRHLMPAVAEE